MNSEYINNMNLYEHHHVHQQKQQQQQQQQIHHNQHMHQQQDQQIYHMQQQIQPQNNLIQMQHAPTTPINSNIIQPNSPHHLQQIHHTHHLQQQQQHSSPQNMNQYQQMNQYHQQQQQYNQSHSTPASPHHLHNQQKQSLPPSPYSPHATSIQTPLQKQLSVISPSHHYQLSPSSNPTTTTNNNINYYQQQQQQQQIINNQQQNKMINPLLKGPDENKNNIHINNNDDINKLQKMNTNLQLPILSKQLPSSQLISPSHNYQIIQPQQQQIQSNLIQQAQIQKVKLSPGFQNQPQPMQQQQQTQKVALPNSVSYYPTTPTQTNSSYQIINQQPTTPLPQQHQTLNSNQMIKSPLINNQVQQQQQFLKTNNNNLMLNSPSINNNNNNTSNQLNYYTNQTTRPNNNELVPQNNTINHNNNNNRINNNFGNNFIDKQLLVNNKPITTTQPAVITPRTSSSNENMKPLIIDNKSANNNKIISENSLLSINSISQISNLIESSLNEEEEQILAEYDCRLYGLLKLEMAENSLKKFFIIKAIVNYEKRINQMTEENFSNYATKEDKLSLDNDKHKCKFVQLAKLYLSLGHFYLLIYDYSKALECYQRFYRFKINKLQDSTFYYGIGLVYFVFGAYKFAARSFLCSLYKDTNFQRVNEIHFRLGIIYKELNNFEFSLKHFKLALIDTSSSLSSVTKSEIKLCIAQLYETNSEYQEAIEKYEDLTKSEINDTNSINYVDNNLKAKAFRHLAWIHYYYSENSNTNNIKPDELTLATPIELESKHLHLKQKQLINSKNLQLSLDYLSKSAQLDSTQNLTWYYLGRALACKGNSREAFISYKNSVNNPEANGDTWCSIGILYYQQKQFMDSLQAFICSIQLDREHFSAWLNLGILYEQDSQFEEALKCYKSAAKCKFDLKRKTSATPIETTEIDIDNIDSEEELNSNSTAQNVKAINKDEVKILKERYKLIKSYLELSADKKKDLLLKNDSSNHHNLPGLEDAFSLQIPTELRQKIVNNNHLNQYNIGLGINLKSNSSNTTSPKLKHKQQQSNRVLTNLTANTSSSNKQQMLNQQQPQSSPDNSLEHLAKKAKISKSNELTVPQVVVSIKPQQIQLMNQLEQNKNHLNPEQLLMLNHLKSQFEQSKLNINNNNINQYHQAGGLFGTGTGSSFLDQLPKDLENVMPITMTQEDNSMLQDLNTLLSRHEIAEDLRISDDDKGSLDHIFSFTNNNNNNNAKNYASLLNDNNDEEDDSNSSTSSGSDGSTFLEKIKLDSSLTNGDNKPSQSLLLQPSNSNTDSDEILKTSQLLPLTDDEVLASKLNIKMNAQQILNECKSYGVNGIQTNSFLKSGRLKTNKQEQVDEYEDACNDIDDTLPNGSLGPESSYLKANGINNSNKSTLLYPATPSVLLETKKDAQSSHLQYFCLSHPISVVRGLSSVLRLDLGLLSTKSLVEVDPEHPVEVRRQRQQSSDENWSINGKQKNVWKCESSRSFTTLLKYAQYQAHSFQEAIRDEKLSHHHQDSDNTIRNHINTKQQQINRRSKDSLDASFTSSPSNTIKKTFKTIKFGTNVDLSDENKWKTQIQELTKLPAFMRVISSGNMLSHIGYRVFGVNTVQMYLKVPGCRTPGHQENNNFCSLNINIGPGDCEWFGVDEKYWPIIEDLCEKNDVDFLNGSWWPNLDELAQANVPVYRFLQKPGDLVWVNAGCVHWVQSVGWCNHVSWNVGPLVYQQYKLAIERYEWNKLKFYKSIVPMVHLSWNLAINIKIQDRRLYEYIRYVLMQSLKQCQLAINYVENCGCEIKYQTRQVDEQAHYCFDCECEVFNILFVSEQVVNESTSKQRGNDNNNSKANNIQHVVHCQACARKRNHLLENFVILHQYHMDELKQIYDKFELYVQSVSSLTYNTTTLSSL